MANPESTETIYHGQKDSLTWICSARTTSQVLYVILLLSCDAQ